VSEPFRVYRTSHASRLRLSAALFAAFAAPAEPAAAVEPSSVRQASRKLVPTGPWPAGDEFGMANAIGAGTQLRCGWHLSQPKARSHELSHVRSNMMPKSPFAGPYTTQYKPTSVLPCTAHAFNSETSCTMILPLRTVGVAGSALRPARCNGLRAGRRGGPRGRARVCRVRRAAALLPYRRDDRTGRFRHRLRCALSAQALLTAARPCTVLRPRAVLSGRRRAARWWSPIRRRAAGAPPSGIRAPG
jgi:hypothetical protein